MVAVRSAPDRRELICTTSMISGVVLEAAALFLALSREGQGSTLPVRATADLLLAGTVEAWAPRWLGSMLYLPVTLAALTLVAFGVSDRRYSVAVPFAITLAVFVAAIGLLMGSHGSFAPGLGYALMVMGALLLCAGSVTGWMRSPERSLERVIRRGRRDGLR